MNISPAIADRVISQKLLSVRATRKLFTSVGQCRHQRFVKSSFVKVCAAWRFQLVSPVNARLVRRCGVPGRARLRGLREPADRRHAAVARRLHRRQRLFRLLRQPHGYRAAIRRNAARLGKRHRSRHRLHRSLHRRCDDQTGRSARSVSRRKAEQRRVNAESIIAEIISSSGILLQYSTAKHHVQLKPACVTMCQCLAVFPCRTSV